MIRVANEENEIWVEFPISFILWTVPLQKLNFEIFDFYVFRSLENFWFLDGGKKSVQNYRSHEQLPILEKV